MELDEALRPAGGLTAEADRLATQLATEVTRRRRVRRRATIATAGGLLIALSAGGVTAAAAATGSWPFWWVEGADVSGVHSVEVADGTRYSCAYEMHTEADFQQPEKYSVILESQQIARQYLRSIDLDAVKPDNEYLSPDGSPTDNQVDDMRAWNDGVFRRVQDHLRKLGRPGVSMSTQFGKCQLIGSR